MRVTSLYNSAKERPRDRPAGASLSAAPLGRATSPYPWSDREAWRGGFPLQSFWPVVTSVAGGSGMDVRPDGQHELAHYDGPMRWPCCARRSGATSSRHRGFLAIARHRRSIGLSRHDSGRSPCRVNPLSSVSPNGTDLRLWF